MEKTTGIILVGMKAIRNYTGRSANTIKRWVKHENFPAVVVDGRWESNTALIDNFSMRRIAKMTEQVETAEA